MAEGFKDFAAGDVLAAADLDDYCVRQSIMVFADATARDAALVSGIRREGMVVANKALDQLEVYNGSAWLALVPYGGWTSYTPTWTQSATITFTTNYSKYVRLGKTVIWVFELTATSAGTASNAMQLTLPVTAVGLSGVAGEFRFLDSAVGYTTGHLRGNSTTVIEGWKSLSADPWGAGAGEPTVAANDVWSGFVIYEAA